MDSTTYVQYFDPFHADRYFHTMLKNAVESFMLDMWISWREQVWYQQNFIQKVYVRTVLPHLYGSISPRPAFERNAKLFPYVFAKWKYKMLNIAIGCQLGVVACTCNRATSRLNLRTAWVRDHYQAVVYVDQVSMLSLVSTWSLWRNSQCTGFDSEVRLGPGRKRSRQKYPH